MVVEVIGGPMEDEDEQVEVVLEGGLLEERVEDVVDKGEGVVECFRGCDSWVEEVELEEEGRRLNPHPNELSTLLLLLLAPAMLPLKINKTAINL